MPNCRSMGERKKHTNSNGKKATVFNSGRSLAYPKITGATHCITEAVADLRPLFSAFCRKIVLPPYFISREYSSSIVKSIYSFNIIDNRNILCYYTHVIDICAVHRNADRMVCAWGFSHCTRWSGLYLSAGSMVFARKGWMSLPAFFI